MRKGGWSHQRERIAKYVHFQSISIHPRLMIAQALVRCIPHGTFIDLRARIYRMAGFRHMGSKVLILGPLTIWGRENLYERLSIGDEVHISTPCTIELNADVRIGDRASIGHHVVIVTTNHTLGPPSQRCGDCTFASVTIGEGAWIGAGAMILPGVTIGAGAVVAAGAIVTKNVAPNTQVAGNPARAAGLLPDGGTEDDARKAAAPPPARAS